MYFVFSYDGSIFILWISGQLDGRLHHSACRYLYIKWWFFIDFLLKTEDLLLKMGDFLKIEMQPRRARALPSSCQLQPAPRTPRRRLRRGTSTSCQMRRISWNAPTLTTLPPRLWRRRTVGTPAGSKTNRQWRWLRPRFSTSSSVTAGSNSSFWIEKSSSLMQPSFVLI